jgi:hypothetical protein
MKRPFNCIGDVDTLIKLSFNKVPLSWLEKQVPAGLEDILGLLSERQLREILIKE